MDDTRGVIIQDAMPPHQMHCQRCGRTWIPRLHSDRGLDTSAREHWQHCTIGKGDTPA